MTNVPGLVEVLTGRMRPRHRRFHQALEKLCTDTGVPYRLVPVSGHQRLRMHLVTRFSGIRALRLDESHALGMLHQSLNRGSMPYMAEFDVPLALHGYDICAHRRAAAEARRLMERPQLRALLVFSDWARRSFELHYGPEAGAKCRTVYPLAFEGAYCGSFGQRHYDFSFISVNFRTKCGPEAIRAFCHARARSGKKAKMCVVTQLAKAREILGDLSAYAGVEWREASLSELEIAQLLAETCCLIHPSLNDSFGVVALEALAAGCALVTTDIASFPELVLDDQNGWLLRAPTSAVVGDSFITEYGTVAYHEGYLNTMSLHGIEIALCESMARLLCNPALARGMMMASQTLYERQFSPQAWKRQMQCVLSEGFPELGTLSA